MQTRGWNVREETSTARQECEKNIGMDGKATRLRNCKTNLARILFERRKERKSTFSSNQYTRIFSRKMDKLSDNDRRKFSTVRNIFQTPRHRCIVDEAMNSTSPIHGCKMNGVMTKRRSLEYIVGAFQKSIRLSWRYDKNFNTMGNCIKSIMKLYRDEGKLSGTNAGFKHPREWNSF